MPTERQTVITTDLTSDQMGYVLGHIDKLFEAQRVYIDDRMGEIVTEALDLHTARLANKSSDYGKPVSTRMADHVVDHYWSKMSKWLSAAIIILALGWGMVWLAGQGITIKGVTPK